MDISEQDAKESLEQIEAVQTHTRKTIASAYESPLLMLWGLIWAVSYLGSYFYRRWAGHIFSSLCGLGVVATFLICWGQFRSANPVRLAPEQKTGWRVFWFWALLYGYLFIWLSFLRPFNGLQMNAFLCTAIMFAYIVTGLWFASYHTVWLGLTVTCSTLIGFYLIPPDYYCLWMAPMAGGVLFGGGLYFRFGWR